MKLVMIEFLLLNMSQIGVAQAAVARLVTVALDAAVASVAAAAVAALVTVADAAAVVGMTHWDPQLVPWHSPSGSV